MAKHARHFRGREAFAALCQGQDWLCYWCGETIHICGDAKCPVEATRDHVIPFSRGGGGGTNIVAACRRCNNKKGDTDPKKWIEPIKDPLPGRQPLTHQPFADVYARWRKEGRYR